MLVSVVIPIYNVEKYLDRCIESVVGQTYKDLEIILVDDGSPDKCPQMCDDWAKKDERIKVIHKKNAGLGMARNTGIESATGEYICFFDSDDYVDVTTIEKCINTIHNTNAEIVCFGHNTVSKEGNIKKQMIPKVPQQNYLGKEVQEYFLPELIADNPETGFQSGLLMSACMMIVSMVVIKKAKWRFVSERDIISEDSYSLLCLYEYVNSVSVLSDALYHYCENGSSLTHTYRKDRYDKIKHYYYECIKICDNASYNQEVRKRLVCVYISFTIAALKQIESSSNPFKDKMKFISEILLDKDYYRILQKLSKNKFGIKRKLILFAMRHKLNIICYFLLKLQNRC